MKILPLLCCIALGVISSLAGMRSSWAAMPAQMQLQNQVMSPAEAAGPLASPGATTPRGGISVNGIAGTGWLIPGIIFDGARSFVTWLELPSHPASLSDNENKERLRDFDGLFAPQMQPHWQAFAEHPTKHYLKNIGTEWVRLDPQRAYKTLSFLFVAANGFLLVSCLIIGIGIGLSLRRQAPAPASKPARHRDSLSG
jgi:hypothetical protein